MGGGRADTSPELLAFKVSLLLLLEGDVALPSKVLSFVSGSLIPPLTTGFWADVVEEPEVVCDLFVDDELIGGVRLDKPASGGGAVIVVICRVTLVETLAVADVKFIVVELVVTTAEDEFVKPIVGFEMLPLQTAAGAVFETAVNGGIGTAFLRFPYSAPKSAGIDTMLFLRRLLFGSVLFNGVTGAG